MGHISGQWTHELSDRLYVLGLLDRRGQVLVSCLGNKNVVLDSHAADGPVLVQHIRVNELAVLGVFE
ncbi:unnamed protein product, partial [Clonostachys rosea f. rosea IK726]